MSRGCCDRSARISGRCARRDITEARNKERRVLYYVAFTGKNRYTTIDAGKRQKKKKRKKKEGGDEEKEEKGDKRVASREAHFTVPTRPSYRAIPFAPVLRY